MLGPRSFPRSIRSWSIRSRTRGSAWAIWRGHSRFPRPLRQPPSGLRRAGVGPCCPMSGHQPVDDVPPPSPETNDRFPGTVCDLGHGHAEHCRRIEHRGISWRQPMPGGFDEICCQQLLAGSTDRSRDQVQRVRHAGSGADARWPGAFAASCGLPTTGHRRHRDGSCPTT